MASYVFQEAQPLLQSAQTLSLIRYQDFNHSQVSIQKHCQRDSQSIWKTICGNGCCLYRFSRYACHGGADSSGDDATIIYLIIQSI